MLFLLGRTWVSRQGGSQLDFVGPRLKVCFQAELEKHPERGNPTSHSLLGIKSNHRYRPEGEER